MPNFMILDLMLDIPEVVFIESIRNMLDLSLSNDSRYIFKIADEKGR